MLDLDQLQGLQRHLRPPGRRRAARRRRHRLAPGAARAPTRSPATAARSSRCCSRTPTRRARWPSSSACSRSSRSTRPPRRASPSGTAPSARVAARARRRALYARQARRPRPARSLRPRSPGHRQRRTEGGGPDRVRAPGVGHGPGDPAWVDTEMTDAVRPRHCVSWWRPPRPKRHRGPNPPPSMPSEKEGTARPAWSPSGAAHAAATWPAAPFTTYPSAPAVVIAARASSVSCALKRQTRTRRHNPP